MSDTPVTKLKRWWRNADYDRDVMRQFIADRPEWSDLPPKVIATSLAFSFYAAELAFRELGEVLKSEFRR